MRFCWYSCGWCPCFPAIVGCAGSLGILVYSISTSSAWPFHLIIHRMKHYSPVLKADYFVVQTAVAPWKEVPLPVGYDGTLSIAISPRFDKDQTLFLGSENNGLLISQDRGEILGDYIWSQRWTHQFYLPLRMLPN